MSVCGLPVFQVVAVRAIDARALWNEMHFGHFRRKRWVRPSEASRYFGVPLRAARQCLSGMASRGEIEATTDSLDRRRRKFRLWKGESK